MAASRDASAPARGSRAEQTRAWCVFGLYIWITSGAGPELHPIAVAVVALKINAPAINLANWPRTAFVGSWKCSNRCDFISRLSVTKTRGNNKEKSCSVCSRRLGGANSAQVLKHSNILNRVSGLIVPAGIALYDAVVRHHREGIGSIYRRSSLSGTILRCSRVLARCTPSNSRSRTCPRKDELYIREITASGCAIEL